MASVLLGLANAAQSQSDEAIIKSTYDSWVEVTNARDIVLWSSYLAPQALFTPPGVPPLETEEAILDYYRDSFADPHFALDCQQLSVDISQSGEMAWARGLCLATFTDSEGEKANGKSRWFKIWMKQADGSWKCRINTWNYESD